MKSKMVMVIPGTKAQIKLIQKLKEMDYLVLCVNPVQNSPGFEVSDFFEIEDILNKEACLNIARRYKVCAVMSDECDIAMPTVEYISTRLKLPTIGTKLTRLYTNKNEMRKFLKKNNLPCPRFSICRNVYETINFWRMLNEIKMIIKPLDSNSSRGVFVVNSEDEIEDKYEKAVIYSKEEKAVICEEYIEGMEFTVDGIVINHKHYSLAISKKKHYDYNQNIACELLFSNQDEEFDYDKLREINNKFVELSNLPFGFTHAEYKYNGKEFVLIEIGARGGGNFISSHIVPYLSGIDTYKILINSIMSNQDDVCILEEKKRNACAILKFFDIERNSGRVIEIKGKEYLEKCSNVILYEFRFNIGDKIERAENDSARVGFYIAVADSRKELNGVVTNIEEKVKIVLEE